MSAFPNSSPAQTKKQEYQTALYINAADKFVSKLDTAQFKQRLAALFKGSTIDDWKAAKAYPMPGAVIPFKRIIAYYGNFYSKGMGILGEIPTVEMLEKLKGEVLKWTEADPEMPAVAAIHYIAVTAQDNPGRDGKYRLRMPEDEIYKAIELARQIDGLVFLDIQVALSTLEQELPELEQFLQQPDVHLGIDPEYSMKGGQVPCSVIGSFDATDINYASGYLAALVRKYKLPPKILVVHRFTMAMVTNYKMIETQPEVQLVMNMDGFGFPAKKIDSYKHAIVNEPVQFTGFKLFYKFDEYNDKSGVMSPEEVLKLKPRPVYIQYQ